MYSNNKIMTISLLVPLLITSVFLVENSTSEDVYGPYNIEWSEYSMCPSSKATSNKYSSFWTNMTKKNDHYIAAINFTFAEDTPIDMGNLSYDIDFTELTNIYIGNKAPYGTYSIKSNVFSKKRQFACISLVTTVCKKN